ncbi:response regulator transcription factor [Nitrospira sp. Nam74]
MPNRSNKEDVDRILIVDDDEATLLVIPEFIATHFPHVIIQTAINADVALSWLRDYRYRLILLDLRMPGMNGLALLGQAQGSLGAARVIVMTGLCDDNLRTQALKAGAYAVLQKPVLPVSP